MMMMMMIIIIFIIIVEINLLYDTRSFAIKMTYHTLSGTQCVLTVDTSAPSDTVSN